METSILELYWDYNRVFIGVIKTLTGTLTIAIPSVHSSPGCKWAAVFKTLI